MFSNVVRLLLYASYLLPVKNHCYKSIAIQTCSRKISKQIKFATKLKWYICFVRLLKKTDWLVHFVFSSLWKSFTNNLEFVPGWTNVSLATKRYKIENYFSLLSTTNVTISCLFLRVVLIFETLGNFWSVYFQGPEAGERGRLLVLGMKMKTLVTDWRWWPFLREMKIMVRLCLFYFLVSSDGSPVYN